MEIELVVFDMAGTTVRDDDAVNRCLRAALDAAGVRVSRDEVNRFMGMPKPLAIQRLLEARPAGAGEGADPRVAPIHADFLRRMVEFYETDPGVSEMPHASALFRQLRQGGVKVALDTGFSRPIVDVILRRLGWDEPGLLDATVASDEVRRGRPHPDLVWRAMELTGVLEPSAVAKVGDTPADLQEGRAAGCALVVGVTCGTHTREQLVAQPHTRLVDDLRELPDLIWPREKTIGDTPARAARPGASGIS